MSSATTTTVTTPTKRRNNRQSYQQEKDVLLLRDNPKHQLSCSPPTGILITDATKQPTIQRGLPSVLTGKWSLSFKNAKIYSTIKILADYIAVTMCDLLPKRQQHRSSQRKVPGLLYFIQKVTAEANISCHVAVVALIYIERCKQALPRNAFGDDDTAHRIFVAALLVAYKVLEGTAWIGRDPNKKDDKRLNNARMATISSIYSLEQINQLECSFLNLIKHQCWVNDLDVQSYLLRHRQDLLL
ncbi:hypothetical protein BJV82DRAFT_524916 [Fennellomyces sp. T-0311]|nr:hypothetical protein BJV82DRAFT_524916 [Fennellomyces sp. T-0311]